jgi:hypothetical protein
MSSDVLKKVYTYNHIQTSEILVTSLQGIQHIRIHMICCRITETYNKVVNFLTYNFSKEQSVLPEDDLMIETCRNILNVLV